MTVDKVLSLELFMTALDEDRLFSAILAQYPDCKIIGNTASTDPRLKLRSQPSECRACGDGMATLINTRILGLDAYQDRFVKKIAGSELYRFGMVSEGLLTLQHAHETYFDNRLCLRSGALLATYSPEKSKAMDEFVKNVWKIIQSTSLKLYAFDPDTDQIISPKPVRRFYCGHDAAEKYDRVNKKFLAHNALAFMTSKRL